MQRYLALLRRQWWVAAIVTVVALVAALIYVERATPVYSASSKVVVGQGQALFQPGLSVDYVAVTSTISSLLQSNVVARQTIDQLGLHTSTTSILNNLSVTSQPDGAVITVSYDDTNQARAVRVLTTIGNIFTQLVTSTLATKSTTTAGAATGSPVSAVVFDPAHADPGQVSPHPTRTLGLALVLGLVAGIVLAFLRDAFSSTIKSEEDAAAAYGATSLGSLPRGALGLGLFSVAALPRAARARIAEAFRMLVARLRYSSSVQRGVIVVVSARPEDGKTTVTAHIAAELAASDNDVIAVEADVHRPALHRLCGVKPGMPGVADVGAQDAVADALLTIDRQLNEAATARGQHRLPVATGGHGGQEPEISDEDDRPDDFDFDESAPGGRLRLLPAGTPGKQTMNLLSLENLSALVLRLRTLADYVVIDTPPLLLSGDAYPLIQLADAVVVVARRGATRHHEAARAKEILHSLGVRSYSLVLTESDSAERGYYGYESS